MTTQITNIEQFIEKHFSKYSTDYIVTEAKFLNSFLNRLVGLGFTLVSANDGEERHTIENNDRFAMLDVIFSVDESSITLISNKDERVVLNIVIGSGDATPIYDHSTMSEELETTIFTEFAKSVKSHSEPLYEMNWTGYVA